MGSSSEAQEGTGKVWNVRDRGMSRSMRERRHQLAPKHAFAKPTNSYRLVRRPTGLPTADAPQLVQASKSALITGLETMPTKAPPPTLSLPIALVSTKSLRLARPLLPSPTAKPHPHPSRKSLTTKETSSLWSPKLRSTRYRSSKLWPLKPSESSMLQKGKLKAIAQHPQRLELQQRTLQRRSLKLLLLPLSLQQPRSLLLTRLSLPTLPSFVPSVLAKSSAM
jgi:hypothetical protein